MSSIPNTTNLTVRVDSALKEGKNMIFNYKPSKELKKSISRYMMKHSEKYKTYHDIDELFDDLDNDD